MLGIRVLATGVTLLVLGFIAIGLYQTGSVENPIVMSLGSIGVALGGFMIIFGFFSSALMEFTPKAGIHKGDTAIFSHTLIRSMIAITVADNELEDEEIHAVMRVYKHLTGSNIDEQLVRDTAGEMLESGIDLISELSNTQGNLDKESKEKIIIASLHILAADGVMDEGEEIFLEEIRNGLRVPKGRFKKLKKDFLKSRKLEKRSA